MNAYATKEGGARPTEAYPVGLWRAMHGFRLQAEGLSIRCPAICALEGAVAGLVV